MSIVVVTGFFDGLHYGHDTFLRTACEHGDRLVVVLGSDAASRFQKGKLPSYSTAERSYMLQMHASVDEVIVPDDCGKESFRTAFEKYAGESITFVINHDGHSESKQQLCESLGIEYVVLERTPPEDLPATSSTDIRVDREQCIPYRINIGGFVDQPYIGRITSRPVPVIVIPIWSREPLDRRSGLATSTRDQLVRLSRWLQPIGKTELEQLLFALENPPGFEYLSGSMDAIGLTTRAIERICYNGEYWPCSRQQITDTESLHWLQNHLFLKQTGSRPNGLLSTMPDNPPTDDVLQLLGENIDFAWSAIQAKDVSALGKSLHQTYLSIKSFVPGFAPDDLDNRVQATNKTSAGCCPVGAGGGGYLLVAADQCPTDCLSFSTEQPF